MRGRANARRPRARLRKLLYMRSPANSSPSAPPIDRLRAIVEDARPRLVLESRGSIRTQVPELVDLPRLAIEDVDDGLAGDWRDPGTRAEGLAFLQYTSGSTAVPKGVMVTLGNLAHN